jgi:hypothetical protein
MSRGWYAFPNHLGTATRTSSGSATAGIRCGYYANGQLIVRISSLAGAGAYLVPYWQASLDGTSWGTLVKGVTAIATGTYIVSTQLSVGIWARCRWVMSSTGVKFGAGYVFRE